MLFCTDEEDYRKTTSILRTKKFSLPLTLFLITSVIKIVCIYWYKHEWFLHDNNQEGCVLAACQRFVY